MKQIDTFYNHIFLSKLVTILTCDFILQNKANSFLLFHLSSIVFQYIKTQSFVYV